MAAKFVVALALIAVGHSSPVLINGILYREGKSNFPIGEMYRRSVNTAQANVNNHIAQASSSSNGDLQLARNGYYNPAQVMAQAQVQGEMQGQAQAQAQTYNGLENPAYAVKENNGAYIPTNFPYPAETAYYIPAVIAKSSAVSNNAGQGFATSIVQNNGMGSFVPNEDLTIIDAKTPIFHTTYFPSAPVQGVASSNANVIGDGSATSSAEINHGKTTSWRYGTLSNTPGDAHAHADAQNNGYGSSSANSDVKGSGSANSFANTGSGTAKSSANSNGASSANADAKVSGVENGIAKSVANTPYGLAESSASSEHGNVKSASDPTKSAAEAYTKGNGNAMSFASTRDVNTALRVTNSDAKSFGAGSAHATAQTA